MKKFAMLSSAVFLLCACSVNKTAVKYGSDIIKTGMPAMLEEEDIQTAKETMLPLTKFNEGLLRNDPKNRELAQIVSQGYCGYAFMFLEDENPARAGLLYKKGAQISAETLSANGILADNKLASGKANEEDGGLLFWNGFCRAGFISLNLNDPDAIADISRTEEIILESAKLAPSYYFNGAQTLMGSLYSSRPKMLGGDLEKAKKYFEAALTNDGAKFQLNRLIFAKTYAVQTQDRALFEKLLGEVMLNINVLPEQRLANKVAAQKAKKLMEKADEIF